MKHPDSLWNQRIGERKNRLILTRYLSRLEKTGDHLYEAKCDCGNMTTITYNRFAQGFKKSCSQQCTCASNKKDLVGKRFNRLVVLEWAGFKRLKRQGESAWLCQCDCGNTRVFQASNLIRGASGSCGCIRNEAMSKKFRTHGMSNTWLYRLFVHIRHDNTWSSFEDFYKDTHEQLEACIPLCRKRNPILRKKDPSKPFGKDNFECFPDTGAVKRYAIGNDRVATMKEMMAIAGVSRQTIINRMEKSSNPEHWLRPCQMSPKNKKKVSLLMKSIRAKQEEARKQQ